MVKRLVVTAAACLCAATAAHAQGPPRIDFSAAPAISIARPGLDLLRFLARPDVRNHLQLGIRQKAALDELRNDRQGTRITVTARTPEDASPDAVRKQVEDQIRAQMGDTDAKLKTILTPGQYQRALQLHLQWRGPLALADPDVAKRVDLTTEHATTVRGIGAEYAAHRAEVMGSLTHKEESSSPDGSQQMVRMTIRTEELDNPLSAPHKKLSGYKKDAEQRILAALSDEEKARWRAAQGTPFVFKDDKPGERF